MTYLNYTMIVCDNCQDHVVTPTYQRGTGKRVSARKFCRSLGWGVSSNENTYCKKCRKLGFCVSTHAL